MDETIHIVETQVRPQCLNCGHVNTLGSEIYPNVKCSKCATSLQREVTVTYLKHCPICRAEFDRSRISGYVCDVEMTFWTCAECDDQPRAMYLHAVWLQEDIGRCCICGDDPDLLILTQSVPDDGEWLCTKCANTEDGSRKIREHWEYMREMNS